MRRKKPQYVSVACEKFMLALSSCRLSFRVGKMVLLWLIRVRGRKNCRSVPLCKNYLIVSGICQMINQTDEAEKWLQYCLQVSKDSIVTTMCHFEMGVLLSSVGRLRGAESHLQCSLEEGSFPSKANMVDCCFALGSVLLQKPAPRYLSEPQGVESFCHALERLEGRHAEWNGRIVECLDQIASMFQSCGRNSEALPLFKTSLKLILGASSLADAGSVAAAHSNLGAILRLLGRDTEALSMLQEAARLWGDSNANAALVESNIGAVLNSLCRPTEALLHLRKSVRILEERLNNEEDGKGQGGVAALEGMRMVSQLLSRMGQRVEAGSIVGHVRKREEALRQKRSVSGPTGAEEEIVMNILFVRNPTTVELAQEATSKQELIRDFAIASNCLPAR